MLMDSDERGDVTAGEVGSRNVLDAAVDLLGSVDSSCHCKWRITDFVAH